MKFYLDTADASQWQQPAGCPPVQGATTNPTLVQQAGLPVTLPTYLRLLTEASGRGLPELMLQLPYADTAEAEKWLDELIPAAQELGVALTLKLPCHPDWEPVIRAVRARNWPFLLTGLSNPMQLLWARAQGADFVAPYLGRLEAAGRDVGALIRACVAVQSDGVRLLAASVKSADVLAQLLAEGAYAVTLRPEFAAGLATDPVTDQAIADFAAEVERSLAHPAV
jgi:transaldolase